MAVKMRLMRMGKTKSPHYRVVVMDGRAPRDGRYIDQIGRYDPRQEPSVIEIDAEKAVDWLRKGAQPTEAVAKILDAAGALTEFKVRAGRIHTVGGAPVSQEEATTEESDTGEPEEATTDATETTEASQTSDASDESEEGSGEEVADNEEADASREA